MKNQVLLLVVALLFATSSFAQQTICGDNLTGKKYWVTKTDQSSYHWVITGGTGKIVSGNGTNEVIVNWEQTTGTATLTVTESNNNSCVGIPTNITVNFSEISAILRGTTQQLCEPRSVEGLQIQFTGESPWDFTYSINDTPVTITSYTGKTYPITINANEYGTDYIVKLISASNAACTGSATGEVTITVFPKIETSEIFFEN